MPMDQAIIECLSRVLELICPEDRFSNPKAAELVVRSAVAAGVTADDLRQALANLYGEG